MFFINDVWYSIVTFLDGSTRASLQQVSTFFRNLECVVYDGQKTTRGHWVARIPNDKFTFLHDHLFHTKNQYLYCVTKTPSTRDFQYWFENLLIRTDVCVGACLCAFFKLKDFITPVDECVIHNIIDHVLERDSHSNQQLLKLRLIVECFKSDIRSLDSLIKCVILCDDVNTVRDIISRHNVSISIDVFMVALTSPGSSREDLVDILLEQSPDLTKYNYWPLRYCIFTDNLPLLSKLWRYYTKGGVSKIHSIESELIPYLEKRNLSYKLLNSPV